MYKIKLLILLATALLLECSNWEALGQEVRVRQNKESMYELTVDGMSVATADVEIVDPSVLSVAKVKAATWNVQSAQDGASLSWQSFQINGEAWTEPRQVDYQIKIKNRKFDPLADPLEEFEGPNSLRTVERSELYLVQFKTQVLDEYRNEVKELGGTICAFMPELTHVVRMNDETKKRVKGLPYVRWIGPMQPYYKLQPSLLATLRIEDAPDVKSRYLLLSINKAHKKSMVERLNELEAKVVESGEGTDIVAAELSRSQLVEMSQSDSVQWIEIATKPEVDTDNARIQGGADFLSGLPKGYSGVGIRGHVLEGVHQDHPDFKANANRAAPIVVENGSSSGHGTNTFGQIFSDGGGTDPAAKGLLPNAQGLYTNYDYVYNAAAGSTAAGSRYELVKRLMNDHKVIFQTASWGYGRVNSYDLRSKEMDDLIFELDIPITQSQSNSGGIPSRPQAWAKNVISIGGVKHFNNSAPDDDRWGNGASTGPAEEGRVKPDLCGYYDQINTTNGASGYTSTFGGTSGATPMVAGHMGLVLEMWTNNEFSVPLPRPQMRNTVLKIARMPPRRKRC